MQEARGSSPRATISHLEARAVLARLRRAALLRCPQTPVGRRARSRARPPCTDGRLARVAFRAPATVTGALAVAASVHGRPLGARRVPGARDRHGCAHAGSQARAPGPAVLLPRGRVGEAAVPGKGRAWG